MYPTISDLLQDIFGLHIPLPIQSFGFMLAISFLAAAYTLQIELKRKEKLGLLQVVTVEVTKGKPATASELITSFIVGFLLGYKLLYALFNYSLFVEDTQAVLLSAEGNLIGGLLVGSLMAYMQYREKEKSKLPQPVVETEVLHPYQMVSNFTIVAAVSGIIGAKIFHNLENLDDFSRNPWEALISFSGLTMYGGLIVGAITLMRYGYKRGIHPIVLADATAPGLMLAYGTGRLGCHIAGDGDWGIVNLNPKPDWLSWLPDWAWSYNYPNNVLSEGIPIPGCISKHCMMLPDAVFPTPLYEAVACILLFFVLWSVRKKIQNTGVVFSLYLLLNGIERLMIEQIRVNNKFELIGMHVTQAEIIAVCLIAGGVGGLLYFNRHKVQYGKLSS